MAIYRGAGGAGDATADAASEALLISASVTAAQTSATNAATSATSASTSATSASTSATNAATSATNASNSASSASTSATNASTSASTATTQASNASTSATAAAASATSASGSASTATTQASNASTSATTASTQASNASASASTASTQATNAAASASAAFTSATNAATSETNAANSATTAASYTPSQTGNAGKYLTTNGTNTSWASVSGGVASVTGTAPVVSSGGTNPAISMPAATTSVSGYLTSTDWNTFNAKSNTNGTVTSVAALTLGTTGTDLSSTVATGTTTPVITLQVPTASASNRGALSSTDWTTFNGKQAALVSGTNIKTVNSTSLLGSGDVSVGVTSVTGTAPVVSSGGATPAISMAAANTTTNGYLTSTDWNTFNGKQAAGSYVTVGGALGTPSSGTLTNATGLPVGGISATGTPSSTTYLRGDGSWSTVSGSISVTGGDLTLSGNTGTAITNATLATVNSNTGSFGSTTSIPVITVNGKGLITAVSTATVSSLPSQTGNSGKYLTTDGTTASWGTVSAGAALSNDTSTASNLYPLFAAATTGTPTTIYTSNAKYLYKPSTGDLSASQVIASNGLVLNNATVSTSYTIATGNNAMSVGPMTVASGQSVTVSSGQRWVVL
jgi:hypothetical protein